MAGKLRDPWGPDIPDLLRRVIGAVDAAGVTFDQIERANGQLASKLADVLSDKADMLKGSGMWSVNGEVTSHISR
jgi:hypothetical protein